MFQQAVQFVGAAEEGEEQEVAPRAATGDRAPRRPVPFSFALPCVWRIADPAEISNSGHTGFGAVFSTTTSVGGAKSGTFSECGTAYLDNRDRLTGIGQGTYESIGKNRWKTADIVQISDGRRLAKEGEVDLASRSWKGTVYEG